MALEAENFQGKPLDINLQPKNFWAFFDEDNGMFLGEMHRHMSHEEEQKNFFCCSQVVLA